MLAVVNRPKRAAVTIMRERAYIEEDGDDTSYERMRASPSKRKNVRTSMAVWASVAAAISPDVMEQTVAARAKLAAARGAHQISYENRAPKSGANQFPRQDFLAKWKNLDDATLIELANHRTCTYYYNCLLYTSDAADE